LHQVVSEKEIRFVRKIKFRIMLPRIRRERHIVNASMEEEMRQLCARLDSMETTQIRAPEAGDVSEAESEDVEAQKVVGEHIVETRLLRDIVNMGTVGAAFFNCFKYVF